MSNDVPTPGKPDNQPASALSHEGAIVRPWRISKEEDSLGSLLQESLKAQVIAGDTSATLKLITNEHHRQNEERRRQLEKCKQETQLNIHAQHQTTIRLGLGLFCATFVGVLSYASFSGDKTLPDRFITLSLGALGGGAGVALLRKNSPSGDRP